MQEIANAKPTVLRYFALVGRLPGARVFGVFMVFSCVWTVAFAISRGAGSPSTAGPGPGSTLLRSMVVVTAEDEIGIVLLRVRHAVIKRFEGRSEFSDAIRMSIDNLAVRA